MFVKTLEYGTDTLEKNLPNDKKKDAQPSKIVNNMYNLHRNVLGL